MQRPTLTIPAALSPHATVIHRLLAPCLDLAVVEDREHSPSGTRLFGEPYLHHLGDWPRNPEGAPMLFVGQCDLGSLRLYAAELRQTLPAEGLLSLFWDVSQPELGGAPEDRYRFRVLWTPRVAGGSVLAPPRGAPEIEVPALCLEPRLAWRLPGEADLAFPLPALDEDGFLAFADLSDSLAPRCENRLLGPADWLEEDARAKCAAATSALWRSEPADWRLLWQVEGDGPLGQTLGGDFRLFVMIRDEDLQATRFLRAWVVVQGL